MKILLVGPPGSGKGTQSRILSKKLELPCIAIGDVLRNYKGKYKSKIDEMIKNGSLAPPEMIYEIIKETLQKKNFSKGFIIEGFPRNLSQAEYFEKKSHFDRVIQIRVSDTKAIKRLKSRMICKCGEVYNSITNPPKIKNKCDKCGKTLIERSDDSQELIKKRLRVYHTETEPMLKFYNPIVINGEKPVCDVTKDIINFI